VQACVRDQLVGDLRNRRARRRTAARGGARVSGAGAYGPAGRAQLTSSYAHVPVATTSMPVSFSVYVFT
jgi:hypothetical protein